MRLAVILDRMGAPDGSSDFVGRDRELGQLLGGLEESLRGRGRLFLIGGEPGIGKSRLIDEFAFRARDRGARILFGRCWEAGGAPPFWPWVECLRAHIRDRDPGMLRRELDAGAADLAHLLPELHGILPDVGEPLRGDPESARFRLFEATATLLANAGRETPLVVVLDDLHAADEPSLLLLRFVARRLSGSRVIIVGSFRDTELSRTHPLTAAVAEVGREASTTRLSLEGLTENAVSRFVEAFTGRATPPALVAAVHRGTEGNPLFVGELVRLLAAEGGLEPPLDEGSWRAVIPEGVRAVIDLRLGRLSDRCIDVLSLASVVGREFTVDVLARVGGVSGEDILAVVDEATEARVLGEVPDAPGRIRFSHGLIRDALYEELRPGRRTALHRRVAETLEELHGADPGPWLAELAHQFYDAAPAGDAAPAVEYCIRAADRAASVLAYEEAVRLYRMALRALDLVPEADPGLRCHVLLGLGEAQARAGDANGSRESFFRAAEIARPRGMAEELARAALGYGGRFVWLRAGGDRRLITLLEEALGAIGEGPADLRARLLARLAGALRDDPDPGRRSRLSREAVEIARRLGDPAVLGYVLDGRWAAIWGADTTEERREIADELIRVAEAAGDGERSFQGRHYRMACLLEVGDLAGARRELAVKQRIAADLRQPAQAWYLAASRALLALFEGRLEEGERLGEEALRVGERAHSTREARFTFLLNLLLIRRDQGRLAELEEEIRRSVEEYAVSYPFIRGVLALLLAELGDLEEARSLLEAMVGEAGVHLPPDNEWLFGTTVLAEVAAAVGDHRRAEVLYEELRPYAGMNVLAPIEAMTGSADRFLGLLAGTMERWSDADRHLADALVMNRRMGAEPAAARTLLGRADVLRSRSEDPEDHEEAVACLTEAADIARRLGLEALAGRSGAGLRALGRELPPGPERAVRAFMFTDIVGSTLLLEAMGDEAWEELRRWHDQALRDLFAEHRGEEVDHAGDGFFVVFPEPAAAVACAVAIQRRLAEHRRAHGFAPRVRIGIHAGEATRSGEGYGGRAVHVAARIGALAEGGEILATAEVLERAGQDRAGEIRKVALKGIGEPVGVAPVRWAP